MDPRVEWKWILPTGTGRVTVIDTLFPYPVNPHGEKEVG